jgi:MFS family permease
MISDTFFILYIIDAVKNSGLGIVLFFGFLIQALFDYPTGVIADWIGQRFVLFFSFISYSLSYFLLYLTTNTLIELIIIFCILSFSQAQFSGAIDSWFDNNYKAIGNDPERKNYVVFQGKYHAFIAFVGSSVLILGGSISFATSRKFVFLLQFFGCLFIAGLIIVSMKDYYEKEKEKISFQSYKDYFSDGIRIILYDRGVFLLTASVMLFYSTLVTFGNFVMYSVYFGYTGTDLGASIFRYIVWIFGFIITWLLADIIKKWDPYRIKDVHFIHSWYFYPLLGLFLMLIPINNTLLLEGALISGFLINTGHLMREIIGILTSRLYLDVIPDRNRNSFYSLIPTLVLIFSAPLTWISGYIADNLNLGYLMFFLFVIALISSILMIGAIRTLKVNNQEISLNNTLIRPLEQ